MSRARKVAAALEWKMKLCIGIEVSGKEGRGSAQEEKGGMGKGPREGWRWQGNGCCPLCLRNISTYIVRSDIMLSPRQQMRPTAATTVFAQMAPLTTTR
eukprot:2807923-Amphidinium_carterae.1